MSSTWQTTTVVLYSIMCMWGVMPSKWRSDFDIATLEADQPSSWETALCWAWEPGRHWDCPLAETHWTETKNTHPSLYVADNSSGMASF